MLCLAAWECRGWGSDFVSTTSPLQDLLSQIRQGDSDAATRLVRDYEHAVRIAVRTRLTDPKLRRQFDSCDVCQSVFGSFFVQVASGEYDLRDPAQLAALLTTIARNKLQSRVRAALRQRRDVRRLVPFGDDVVVDDRGTSPQAELEHQELLERTEQALSEDILELARLRKSGATWDEIAAQLGGTSESRRKQFERAVERVAATLKPS